MPLVLSFVRDLAENEKLSHLVVATEEVIAEELFGPKSHTEVLLGHAATEPVAFAVYFHNFSTFLGRKGLYLEDLYVRPARRRRGFGRAMLLQVARIAAERNCGRLEWSVGTSRRFSSMKHWARPSCTNGSWCESRARR